MLRTIKAIYRHVYIELIDEINLAEGTEVAVIVDTSNGLEIISAEF